MEQTLGKRIVENRKRLGLTQEQLAAKLEVSAQAVSKWENDQSCPDIFMLPRLADIFGITTDALLGRQKRVFEGEVVDETPEKPEGDIQGRFNNWEFGWDGGKKSALGFAVFVLAVGGLYLASQLASWGYNLWEILWPTALLTFGVFGLFPDFSFFHLGCTLFGGYFLTELFVDIPLNLDSGLIWAVIIVIFGLSLLADALKKPDKPRFFFHYTDKNGKKIRSKKGQNDMQIGDDDFVYHGNFGETEQYVQLVTMRFGQIQTSFGDYTMDLTGVQTVSPDCRLEIIHSFGHLELRVPKRFQIKPVNSTAFAAVHITGQPDAEPAGCILVDGNISFGEIEIVYV